MAGVDTGFDQGELEYFEPPLLETCHENYIYKYCPMGLFELHHLIIYPSVTMKYIPRC